MDLTTLANIDDGLDSSEVDALCFLCQDVVSKKNLKKVQDGKDLFRLLGEKELLRNGNFLSQLLRTINRPDLLRLLEGDATETDSIPTLTHYRVTLYKLYEDITAENLKKMKYLLGDHGLGRGQIEPCTTALDVFILMESSGLLSEQQLDKLIAILKQCDLQLVNTLQSIRGGYASQPPNTARSTGHQDEPHVSMGDLTLSPVATPLSVPEMSSVGTPGDTSALRARRLSADSEATQHGEFYALKNNPRGTCVVINNENFSSSSELTHRKGTQEDEKSLRRVFGKLGFVIEVHRDLTAKGICKVLGELAKRSFLKADVLVVCVLSHGEKECVLGTDGNSVSLWELRSPFTSGHAPTLAGKPKLFFIQACQGSKYQEGVVPLIQRTQESDLCINNLESDAGPLRSERVADEADFLMGMATVEDCRSFRHTLKGSFYIQELCKQLMESARIKDDLLSTLTRVNRQVSKGDYNRRKQMPQPKYTLTKKLVLTEMDTAQN